MKRFFLMVLMVIVGGLLPLSARQKGPSIVFDSISKNFNKVPEGEVIRHVFKFANKGDATLEIVRVDASCGCTTALLSADKIAPGRSGEIEVKVETKDLSATELNKTISVMSNDPKQPVLTLTITGSVEPEFMLSELSIFFGNVPRGQEVSREIVVTVPPDKSSLLVSAASTDAQVTVKLEPVAGSNGKKYRVIAVQKPDTAEGYHFGTINIKTTSRVKPELKIPVRGLVVKAK